MSKLLLDTDIIIDHLRGFKPATHFFLEKKSATFFVSAITVAELHAGMRNSSEQSAAETFLNMLQVIPINHEIAIAGGQICKEYRKSHGTGLPDAIIAATSQHHEATLVTLNAKHFPMIKTLKPYKK